MHNFLNALTQGTGVLSATAQLRGVPCFCTFEAQMITVDLCQDICWTMLRIQKEMETELTFGSPPTE